MFSLDYYLFIFSWYFFSTKSVQAQAYGYTVRLSCWYLSSPYLEQYSVFVYTLCLLHKAQCWHILFISFFLIWHIFFFTDRSCSHIVVSRVLVQVLGGCRNAPTRMHLRSRYRPNRNIVSRLPHVQLPFPLTIYRPRFRSQRLGNTLCSVFFPCCKWIAWPFDFEFNTSNIRNFPIRS